MKKLMLLLVLCFITLPLFAQDSQEKTTEESTEKANTETYFEQYRLGLFWSSYKGSGIHVGIPINDRLNFDAIGLIYFTKNGNEEETTTSLGLSFSYDVFESINRRFYLSAGLGRNGETTKYGFNDETEKSSFRYGVGAGVEFRSSESKGFFFVLDVGYHTIYRGSLNYIGLGGGFGFGYIF